MQYLEDMDKWEVKWGSWSVLPDDAKPRDMEKRPEPPYELVLWHQCKEFGQLLVSGGVLEQPFWTWTLMNACGAAVSEYEYKQNKVKEINERLKANG